MIIFGAFCRPSLSWAFDIAAYSMDFVKVFLNLHQQMDISGFIFRAKHVTEIEIEL